MNVVHITLADNFKQRLLGLMFKTSIPDDLILCLRPCSSVHTFFMRFSIDIAYVDGDDIVLKIIKKLKPWRVSLGPPNTRYVLEFNADKIEYIGLKAGNKLHYISPRCFTF